VVVLPGLVKLLHWVDWRTAGTGETHCVVVLPGLVETTGCGRTTGLVRAPLGGRAADW